MGDLGRICCALLVGLGIGEIRVTFAHTIVDSLGAPIKAVDIHQVSCSDDGNGVPTKLVAQIRDNPPSAAPIVNLMTFKSNAALSVSDPVDGDKLYSRRISNSGGAAGANGVFNVFVSKTAAGVESYEVEVHCMSSTSGTDVHTGTDVNPLQDR
jgi:hypothetical protein